MGEFVPRWWERAWVVWLGFSLVSIWLGWEGYVAEAIPYGDVTFVYEFWAKQAINGGPIVGLETVWVYPIVALIPILLPLLAGPGSYAIGWIVLVSLANAAAIAVLLYADLGGAGFDTARASVRQRVAAWWWIAFMLVLGPISVARLDTIVTPLVIIGLVLVAHKPILASSVVTIAAWIKVWPAAAVVAMITVLRQRRQIFLGAIISSVVIVLIAIILGGANSLLSFLTEQTGRGLQIEAPLATPFLWLTSAGVAGYAIYYDTEILTFQVSGDGTEFTAMLSNVLLGLSFLAALLWGWKLQQKSPENAHRIFPGLVLVLVLVLVVFNKVGSPQYMGWLAAPIVAGLVISNRDYSLVAWLGLILAGLTHAFYPYMYQGILGAAPFELAVLTARNIGEIVMLLLAVRVLYVASKRDSSKPTNSDSIKNAS